MLDKVRKLLPRRWRSDAPVIPVVRLTGPIAAGGSQLRPSLSIASTAALFDRAFEIKAAPAVAIIINSPGGSPVQSRLIYKRIRDLAQEKDKKVLVFVEDAAASGGYMIACAGDEIIADPCSVIGSIGVVAATFGFSDAISRIGVERRVYTAGTSKVSLDPFQKEKKEDVAKLNILLADMHDVFINLVKQGRGNRLADNPDIFTGQYGLAEKALALGLIDSIGDIRSVIKNRYGEKAEMKLISAPRGLFRRRAGLPAVASFSDAGAGLADEALARIDEQALWARLGLNVPR
ncbi:MAG: S49 family peptidase [Notoacmeibacter sp.]